VRPVAGHVARKRFGQHFLVDASVIAAIVAAIDPREGQVIVEIGPGLAALTAALLERVPRLHAVEIDRDLAARLRRRWEPGRLGLHERVDTTRYRPARAPCSCPVSTRLDTTYLQLTALATGIGSCAPSPATSRASVSGSTSWSMRR